MDTQLLDNSKHIFSKKTPIEDIVNANLEEGEKLLWTGIPEIRQSIHPFKSGNKTEAIIYSIILIFVGIETFDLIIRGKWENGLFYILLAFLIGGVFRFIIQSRNKQTAYAFTNKRIFFKLGRWGKIKVQSINMEDIGQFYYEEHDKSKSGTLHFLPIKMFNFSTHDYETGAKRHYPTFENIPDVIALSERLTKLKNDRNKSIDSVK